jgi:MoaA/NifB/PqqE/SkfB family radical SAM enzyme
MKLENIGFYTLSDYRASQTSRKSPLWRCELILTDKCNFSCQYCRGLRHDISGTLSFNDAIHVLDLWCADGLKNVRFSGGEPTLYKELEHLVSYCKKNGVEHIAVSTNGSADWSKYEELNAAGVNDFSVSLDSCCSAIGDKMSGGITGTWKRVVENIGRMSEITYTTVGIVINEDNLKTCIDTIIFANSLGVSDIRVIPSSQYNKLIYVIEYVPDSILEKHPIFRYRVNNVRAGRNVRGIKDSDCKKCWLALDDMAIAGGYHFPCIIYMREQGNYIGKVGKNMRQEREDWVRNHDSFSDVICRKNCLDVCIDYCNKVEEYNLCTRSHKEIIS